MSSQVTATPTQYAIKKRKRPQPRPKNAPSEAPVKSNPSKRHRDRLNTELERLSQLIPLPQDVVNKLDKLSILRLSVAYLRNKSYSQHIELEAKSESKAILPVGRNQSQPTTELTESELAMQAMDGFIIVVTQDFNVFYITSSVQDCLGFPQSDVIYQSMLELIHAEDRKVFMKQMLVNPMGPGGDNIPEDGDPPETPDYIRHGLTPEVVKQLSRDGLLHRSFICRLRCLHDTSSGFLALHFTGHLGLVPGQNRREKDGTQLPPELGLFLLASPLQTPSILEIRTKNYIFRTRHKLDYTPLGIDQKGRIVLGYTEQELRQQSGYQFIHSADMMHCADAHTKLMRNGQSGLTVFRLLHRANRWQWVTASARLIFNKGVPDYIISTHRPITEQEGEEHLKKRSVAFRFDFTGHASLYLSVNPIGAGGPPPSNGPSEAKPHVAKRPRIAGEEVDPATLYGAQSFQSMDNYREGLPNISPTTETMPIAQQQQQVGVIKSESQGSRENDVGYFNDSPGVSSQSSPLDITSPFNGKASSSNGHSSDSGFSDTDYNASPGYNRILENLLETDESPPLYHPPITNIDTTQYGATQTVANGHSEPAPNYNAGQLHPGENQCNDSAAYWNQTGQYGSNGNQSTVPNPTYQQSVSQDRQWVPQAHPQHQQVQQQHPQHPSSAINGISPSNHDSQLQNGVPQHHYQMAQYGGQQLPHQRQQPAMMQQHVNDPYNTQPYQQPLDRNHYHGNPVQPQVPPPQFPDQAQQMQRNAPQTYQGQYPNQQQRSFPTGSATKNFMDQLHRPDHNLPRGYQEKLITAQPKENVSLLNSVEITSKLSSKTIDERKELEDIMSMIGPGLKEVNTEKFQVSFEVEEQTVQFDLHKIATEFQTANPLGLIQEYVQKNPAQAIALATGNMPETQGFQGNGLNPNDPHQAMRPGMYPNHSQNLMPNGAMHPPYPVPQALTHELPNANAGIPPNLKTELRKDDLDADLEEFLNFDIPNLEG